MLGALGTQWPSSHGRRAGWYVSHDHSGSRCNGAEMQPTGQLVGTSETRPGRSAASTSAVPRPPSVGAEGGATGADGSMDGAAVGGTVVTGPVGSGTTGRAWGPPPTPPRNA